MSHEASQPDEPIGLLLTRDLIFTSKVTGTGQSLGRRILTAGNEALASSLIEERRPRVVFIDLAAGGLVRPEALAAYRTLAGDDAAFVAFGSHVDTEALARAMEAGCDPVLPRSRFTTELPDLIRRFLPEP